MTDGDVLVLYHFRFQHERHHDPTTKFRTTWVPGKATYHRMLSHLRAEDYCEQEGVTCRLYFNNLLWPSTDQAVRHFRPGDYLRLNIDSSDKHFCDLVDAENADRERRLYTNATSSESEERQTDDKEDEWSRSRSRGESEVADSPSLIQISVKKQRTPLQRTVATVSTWRSKDQSPLTNYRVNLRRGELQQRRTRLMKTSQLLTIWYR